ncbi:MAG: hypothetical protein BYD32DRAFT_464722 [Podila humilis]|nr:MAG: hypothetical protein BYD32DRAFT_464722 [Podila humilis]
MKGTSSSSTEDSSSHTVPSIQCISQTPPSTKSCTFDEFAHLITDSQLAEAVGAQSSSTQSINPNPCVTVPPVNTVVTSTTDASSTPASLISSSVSSVLATSQSENSIIHDPHEIMTDTVMTSLATTEGSKTRGVVHSSVSGSHSFDPYNRVTPTKILQLSAAMAENFAALTSAPSPLRLILADSQACPLSLTVLFSLLPITSAPLVAIFRSGHHTVDLS